MYNIVIVSIILEATELTAANGDFCSTQHKGKQRCSLVKILHIANGRLFLEVMLLVCYLSWSREATRCPDAMRELRVLCPAGRFGGSAGCLPCPAAHQPVPGTRERIQSPLLVQTRPRCVPVEYRIVQTPVGARSTRAATTSLLPQAQSAPPWMELAGAPCSPSAPGWDGKRKKFEWKAAVIDGVTVSILLDERSYFPGLALWSLK